jgi:hypothetical protein
MTLAKSEQRRDDQSPAHVPGVTSRRAFMNSIVALPIAAALPVAAPAMLAKAISSATDRRALEAYASWLFMERRILCGELWPDEGAQAERYDWHDNAGAGWHLRGRGDVAWNEGPQPSSRAAAVLDLVGVDWRQPKENLGLNHADTGARPALPPGWPERDGELLRLTDEYLVALRTWCELNIKVDRIEFEIDHRRTPKPDVLRCRETDADIGLPPLYPLPEDHGAIWDRPMDIDPLRAEKWWTVTTVKSGDEISSTCRAFEPSPAARARAAEIIAAFDAWRKKDEKPPRGFKKLVRERDRAWCTVDRLEQRIADIRATTLEGMRAKIRCAQAFAETDHIQKIEENACSEVMALSIFMDIQQLTQPRAAPPHAGAGLAT